MRKRLLSPGDLVAGKYSVKALLGEGGMGAVYLVRHAVTGKRLALKVLHATSKKTTEAEKRLIREAIATGQIDHRNVVNVFDLDEHEGSVFLVMEYLEGKTLKQLFSDQKLSDHDFIEIMLRAMEGVRAAHAEGVVHRDLKPDNIFVCTGPSGKLDDPRVLDFGVCRLTMNSELTELTKAGLTLGSPYYMSLEQFEGARDIDGRADIYSLGVILYEGLTGRRPFEARSLGELTAKIASGQPPMHLGELRPDLPKGLTALVMRAIARHRNKRPHDMKAFIAELSPYLPKLELGAEISTAKTLARLSQIRVGQKSRPRHSLWSFRNPKTRAVVQVLSAGLLAFVVTLTGIRLARLWAQNRAGVEPAKAQPAAPQAAVQKPARAVSSPKPSVEPLPSSDDAPGAEAEPLGLDEVTVRPGRAAKAATASDPGAPALAAPKPAAIDTQDPYQ